MSDSQNSDVPAAGVRPEIWGSARAAWNSGLFEEAIFAAFKAVESRIQHQSGSRLIGDQLIEHAFGTTSGVPKIEIGQGSLDRARAGQLFQGSLGLFKGSRSHGGVAPSIPAEDDPDYATRLLVIASALLDLLDRDQNLAPRLLAEPQVDGELLVLYSNDVDGDTTILIDNSPEAIVYRSDSRVELSLAQCAPGSHTVILARGRARSAPASVFVYEMPPRTNWHRVVRTAVATYSDPACTAPQPFTSVLLESFEAGHRYERVFPTRSTLEPGDYASWEWDSGDVAGESWVRIDGGTYQPWSGSMFFAGVGTSPVHEPRVSKIEVRPRSIEIGPSRMCRIRVISDVTDGTARWDEDVTSVSSFSSSDESIAYCDTSGVVYAKKNGRVRIRAAADGRFGEVECLVGSVRASAPLEYLGGIPSPRGLTFLNEDLLTVNGSGSIWAFGADTPFTSFANVSLPRLSHMGFDSVRISENRKFVAVRNVSSRSVHVVPVENRAASREYRSPHRDATPMCMLWRGETRYVFDHTGLCWTFDPETASTPTSALFETLSVPVAVAHREGLIWMVRGGSDPLVYQLDAESGAFLGQLHSPEVSGGLSGLALSGNEICVSEFSAGRVWLTDGETWTLLADGLEAPTDLGGHRELARARNRRESLRHVKIEN
jgi:hypothetical protein